MINKFDSFFKVTRNVIFERARFNQRVQVDGETAELTFTTWLSFVTMGFLLQK